MGSYYLQKAYLRDRIYKFPTLSGYCATLLLWKTTTSSFFACHDPVYLVINPKDFSQTDAIKEAQNEIEPDIHRPNLVI